MTTPVQVERFRSLLEQHRHELTALATTVETARTARTEWEWALAALNPQPHRTHWLAGRRPLGAVYVRMPATLPVYSFALFAVGALLPGNRVVLRPAGPSRHVVEPLVRLAHEAGLPIELRTGTWEDFETEAKESANGFVFCGGSERAERLAAVLPDRTRLLCQGPGCCAFVVTAGADPVLAAEAVVRTRLFNSSQDCLATERVYVADPVLDRFLAALDTQLDKVSYGADNTADVDVGPLLLDAHAADWYSRIAGGEGSILRPGANLGGSLYETCVVEAAPDSALVLDEKYCPVLPVVRYRNDSQLQDMLRLGDYALGLTVQGRLPSFGTLDFGHVAVGTTHYDLESPLSPFGGYRRTTFVRADGSLRRGPALVPFEMSTRG
ncbi:aldehyde dehydrogenase family protein [Kitasatospora sp. NPDC089913]|uniref:aldehyde dehydrogenase family protein n=1 Tax=Kitasatospora sp. NPDC089913 TaxID=3364080 RepID=UPI00381D2B7F